MEQIISKKELDELMKLKGEIRGIALKAVIGFVLREKGEDGLKKLKDTITNLDFPIKYKEIRAMEFYSISLWALLLLTIKKLFNFDDKKFQELGRFESKASLILRLSMRYFFSIDKVAKEAPNMWKKAITVGDFKVVEYNENKKYVILRLENLPTHPLQCQFFQGYFSSVVQMVVKSPVTCEETKCVHRGDEYHEFLAKWQ